MSTKYSEKLKDPRWQKKRLEVLERDAWGCIRCGKTEETLHVHHKNYLSGKDPWDIPSSMLCTLCKDCHDTEKDEVKETTAFLRDAVKNNFIGPDIYAIANGFYNIKLPHHPEVTASLIEWVLRDEKLMDELLERYFQDLSNRCG